MKSLILGNWKMNPRTFKEAQALFDETKRMIGLTRGVSMVVLPPAIFLRDLAAGQRKGRVAFGVQNIHFEEDGAHTGEMSVHQASDSKATYVLVGHAERREMGESNDDTRKKVAITLAAHMTPVLCIGEKNRESAADHFNFVREQLRAGLADVPEKKLSKMVIVYEPLWAIGQATAMQPRQMHEMSIFIRKTVVEKFGEIGHTIKILYGGSVDATNAPDMLRNGDVKGLLVGRASADAQHLTELLRAIHDA